MDITEKQFERLGKLLLTIKQPFKFLYSLCLCLKNSPMFSIRQSQQIGWSVISPHSIKMMNNPSLRQRFAACFFPDKNMFCYIAFLIGSCVLRSFDSYIARCITLSTFPRWVISTRIFPFHKQAHTFNARFRGTTYPPFLTNGAQLCFSMGSFIITDRIKPTFGTQPCCPFSHSLNFLTAVSALSLHSNSIASSGGLIK